MKRKYSISYFVFITATIITFVYAFSFNNAYQMDKYTSLDKEINQESYISEEIIISNSEDIISEGYYLKEQQGCVIVYLYDGETVFEETDILLNELTPELQSDIRSGKYIKTTEELYSFLENYSS